MKNAIALVAVLASFTSGAQTLTNLAGIWNGIYFDTPSHLIPQSNAQGLVTNVTQHDLFQAESFQIDIQPDGTFEDPEEGSGSFSISGQGVINVTPPEGGPLTFFINASQDTLVGLGSPDGNQEIDLLVKAPATFSTNDLVGTWNLMTFATPNSLIQVFMPTTNGSAITDLIGSDSNSVDYSSFSQINSGTMTFSNNGTLVGMLQGEFTGTFNPGANGVATLEIQAEETLYLTGFINVSKDVLLSLNVSQNRQELIMLTKPPVTMTTADLQGIWKVTSFSVPTEISLTRNSSNFVTDVTVIDGFGMHQQGSFVSGHDGFLTAMIDGIPNIGAVTLGSNGALTVNLTNTFGEVQSHSGHVNASKDTIMLVENDGDNRTFTVVTRAPKLPGATTQDFGMLLFGNMLYWASDTNRVLQTTGSLNSGSWNDILSTQGQHGYQPSYTNSAEFFRVAE